MDSAVFLGLLLVLVVLDTVAIGGLLVVTLRDRRPGRGRPAAWPATQSEIAAGPAAAQAPRPSADPLAEAITAFLDRPDGLFRTGSAARSFAPGPPPTVPDPARAPLAPAEARRPATTPPSRYVASGTPVPAEPAPQAAGPAVPAHPFTPGAAEPAPRAPLADRRPAMRLEVGLVGRDARSAAASDAAVRLGPVIGGLLRERTRAGDTVVASGPGRFAAILPDASRAGAAALAERLEAGCDAWLAAELPPLRLELAVAEQPGGLPPAPAAAPRVVDPDRRRSIRSAT